MHILSKVCDAADWFDPEILGIIQNELQEPPRFHRKQWEFALIFLALRKYGLLEPDKLGLCVGGGKERLLYSIARRIRQLVVTDLYDTDTTWDCAKTDDPDHFIKTDKPFPVDDAKLRALRMDMRQLEFPDNSFDFCYSSCSIEHIGDYPDFLRHLQEVHRVLKEGGIYVFTTELHFGDETIKDPNNFVFSPAYLRDLIAANPLAPDQQPDVSLAPHRANFPLPSNIKHLIFSGKKHLGNDLMQEYPHLILLRGKHPFTSVSLILRKNSNRDEKAPLAFQGLEKSRRFLEEGIAKYRNLLETREMNIYPFSALPAGVSRYFLDHAEYFSRPEDAIPADDTIFHSDYAWLGSGPRTFRVRLQAADLQPGQSRLVQLRIHRYTTLASRNIHCVAEENLKITAGGPLWKEISITTDENSCYAVLGKMVEGACRFNEIEIRSVAGNSLAARKLFPDTAEKETAAKGIQKLRLSINGRLKRLRIKMSENAD